MATTARELIIDAYYLSAIVSQTFETVTGNQITIGLKSLNELLSVQSIRGSLIPYVKEYTITAVVGQEKYFVPNLISIETGTFNIGTIRYRLEEQGRVAYFGNSRADNIESIPYKWHLERVYNGADIYLYFLPANAYPVKIIGKFGFDEITDLCQDISLVYAPYYVHYLKYLLAVEICNNNHHPAPPGVEGKLLELKGELLPVGMDDLEQQIYQQFGKSGYLSWADINLGDGWRPF